MWKTQEDITLGFRDAIKRDCIADEILHLKVGAFVMILCNDGKKRRYANGSLAKVTGFVNDGNFKTVWVQVDNTGEKVALDFNDWKKLDSSGANIVAKFEQIPLKLAYAITIHKSQGMTLDYADIDISRCFSPGQAYVAMSRVRSINGLRISGDFDPSMIVADNMALRFYKYIDGRDFVTDDRRNTKE